LHIHCLRAIALLGGFLLISSAYAESKEITSTLAQVEQKRSDRASYKGIVGEIDSIAQKIIVCIDSTNNGNGSGVIIARDGNIYYVLTAAHVVKQPDRYQIIARDR
jgi:S1-C subfamily serine protease